MAPDNLEQSTEMPDVEMPDVEMLDFEMPGNDGQEDDQGREPDLLPSEEEDGEEGPQP